MPARPTAARRRSSSTSAGVGAAHPRLSDAYASHRSSRRVLPHACARQRSSPRVLSKWLDGSSGQRRRWMPVKVLKMLNASNIEEIPHSTNSCCSSRSLQRRSQFTVMTSRQSQGSRLALSSSSSATESLDLPITCK